MPLIDIIKRLFIKVIKQLPKSIQKIFDRKRPNYLTEWFAIRKLNGSIFSVRIEPKCQYQPQQQNKYILKYTHNIKLMKFACSFRGSWQFFFLSANVYSWQFGNNNNANTRNRYTHSTRHTHKKTQFLQILCLCVEFFGSLFFSIEFRMLPFSYSFLIRVTHCCFCWMSFFFVRSFVRSRSVVVCANNLLLPLQPRLPSTLSLLRSIPLANSLAIMNDVFDVRLYSCVLTVEITAFFRCVLHFALDLSKSK